MQTIIDELIKMGYEPCKVNGNSISDDYVQFRRKLQNGEWVTEKVRSLGELFSIIEKV